MNAIQKTSGLFRVECEERYVLLIPLDDVSMMWIIEHVEINANQRVGRSFAFDPPVGMHIALMMCSQGLRQIHEG